MSLRAQLRQLASESAIYGVAPLAHRVIAIFLTPLYTRVFLPADYGALSLVDSVVALLGPLAVLALDSAAFRWFYDASNEEEQRSAVATWFWTQLGFATALALLVAAIPASVMADLTDRADGRLLLVVAVAALPFAAFESVVVNHARMQRRAWQAVGVMMLSSLVSILLTLAFVLVLRLGVIGVLLSTLLTRVLLAAVAIRLVGAWIAPSRFQTPLLRAMLRYSLPMVPTALFSWIIAASNRFFVARHWNASEVGLYSIGLAIAGALVLVTSAFHNAWSAFAFSIKDRPDAPRTYAIVMEAFLFGACFIALGLSIFAPEALRILTVPRYYGAENVVAPLTLGFVMAGLYQITGLGAMLVRNTRPLLYAFALAALVSVACNAVLIPRFGRVGAAYAALAAQAVLPLFLLWRSQRLFPIPYRSWLVFVVPLSTLAVALLTREFTAPLSLAPGIAVKLAVVVGFGIVLMLLSPVRSVAVAWLLRPSLR